MILLDTNVLARMTDSGNPHCALARRAVHVLLGHGERLIVVPQNGLGMTPDQASQWLGFFQRRFTLLPDHDELFTRWHALVKALGVKGLKSYDARLVTAMQGYGITQLLTFNAGDFKRFPVTVIDPASL